MKYLVLLLVISTGYALKPSEEKQILDKRTPYFPGRGARHAGGFLGRLGEELLERQRELPAWLQTGLREHQGDLAGWLPAALKERQAELPGWLQAKLNDNQGWAGGWGSSSAITGKNVNPWTLSVQSAIAASKTQQKMTTAFAVPKAFSPSPGIPNSAAVTLVPWFGQNQQDRPIAPYNSQSMVYYTVLGPIGLNLQPGAPVPFPTRQQGASQLPQSTYGYGNPADSYVSVVTVTITQSFETRYVYATSPSKSVELPPWQPTRTQPAEAPPEMKQVTWTAWVPDSTTRKL